jgi:hypothetical protein
MEAASTRWSGFHPKRRCSMLLVGIVPRLLRRNDTQMTGACFSDTYDGFARRRRPIVELPGGIELWTLPKVPTATLSRGCRQ